jgi:hypothetical protein
MKNFWNWIALVGIVGCSSHHPSSPVEGLKAFDPKFLGFEGRKFYTDGHTLYRSTVEGEIFKFEVADAKSTTMRPEYVKLRSNEIQKKIANHCPKVSLKDVKISAAESFVIDTPRWERGAFEVYFLDRDSQSPRISLWAYQRYYVDGLPSAQYRLVLLGKDSITELCSFIDPPSAS